MQTTTAISHWQRLNRSQIVEIAHKQGYHTVLISMICVILQCYVLEVITVLISKKCPFL